MNGTPPYGETITFTYIAGPEYEYITVTAFTAYVAVVIGRANVQLMNLCGEVLRESDGVVGTVAVYKVVEGKEIFLGEYSIGEGLIAVKVPIRMKFNATGWPVIEKESAKVKLLLHYYGYELPMVNPETREEIESITVESGKIVDVYFPLINVNVKVTSSPPIVEPLVGFVVRVNSTELPYEMWRVITNESGLAYIKNIPIEPYGKVMIQVRTIIPNEDREWFEDHIPFNETLADYKQNYAEYAAWLGLTAEDNVYTLGTRGPFDQGLVVLNTTLAIPKDTLCNEIIELPHVEVRSLVVYVVDEEGNVISSMPIYPCSIPGYCPGIYYNVTLVVADRFSPYVYSTRWYNFTELKFYNLTDFRIVGITWMKKVFERLAEKFKEAEERALDMRSDAIEEENETKLILADYYWIANETYRFLAEMLAKASTDSPYAIFNIPSMPRGPIVRLFMTGQRFPVKVYYLGYEVFNNIIEIPPANMVAIVKPTGEIEFVERATVKVGNKVVNVTPGSVVIYADVHPVTIKVTDKAMTYLINKTYIALTFTDALIRTYVWNGTKIYEVRNLIKGVISPVASVGPLVTGNVYVLKNASRAISVGIERTIPPAANATPAVRNASREYRSRIGLNNVGPVKLNAPYMISVYLLPNIGGVYVNETEPTLDIVAVPISDIYEGTIANKTGYHINATLGYPIWVPEVSAITFNRYEFNATPLFTWALIPKIDRLVLGGKVYEKLVAEHMKLPDRILYNGSEVTARDLVVVDTVTTPTSTRFAPVEAFVREFTEVKTLNLTIIYKVGKNFVDYRLVEFVINATGIEKLEFANLTIYVYYKAAGEEYRKKVTSLDITELVKKAMERPIPVYVWINYSKVVSLMKEKDIDVGSIEYILVLLIRYEGEVWILELGNATRGLDILASTGFGGTVKTVGGLVKEEKPVVIYIDSEDTEHKWNFTKIKPDEVWKPYFGSPFTIIVPAPNGVVKVEIPSWTITSGAWGTRIARVWILATKETPNIGFGEIKIRYDPAKYGYVGVLPIYEVRGYVLLNYLEPVKGAKKVKVAIFGEVESEGDVFMTGVGVGTGGTSTLMYLYDEDIPANLFNVTKAAMVTLRTVALSNITIINDAYFPVVLYKVKVEVPAKIVTYEYRNITGKWIKVPKFENKTFTVVTYSLEKPIIVEEAEVETASLKYAYGTTYMIDTIVDDYGWCDIVKFIEYRPKYKIYVKYYPPTYVYYDITGEKVVVKSEDLLPFIKEIKISFRPTMLYAASMPKWKDVNTTVMVPFMVLLTLAGINIAYNITQYTPYIGAEGIVWPIAGYIVAEEHDIKLPTLSNDTAIKVVFYYPELKLTRVLDWSGRPLANVTVVVYEKATDDLCEPIGISFTNATGELVQKLPYGERVIVTWYDSFIRYLFTVCRKSSGSATFAGFAAERYPFIVIYDSNVARDVEELGDARSSSYVRTWTYQFVVKVVGPDGRGIPDVLVVAYDNATGGKYFYASGLTGPDGSVTLIDPRSGFGGKLSQAPPTEYIIEVYKPYDGWLVGPITTAKATIERGATRPAVTTNIMIGGAVTPITIKVVALVPGEYVGKPAAGAKVKVIAISPAIKAGKGYAGLIIPVKEEKGEVKVLETTYYAGKEGLVTTDAIYIPAKVEITVEEWKNIPLGIKYVYTFTGKNATAPAVVKLEATKVKVIALSENRQPLGEAATVTVKCSIAGREITETGVGKVVLELPVPPTGEIRCDAIAETVGGLRPPTPITFAITKEDALKLKTVDVVIPGTAGIYVPYLGFMPWSTLIAFIVVIFIVIIIIVILLMEYSTWRRKRLMAVLGPPRP